MGFVGTETVLSERLSIELQACDRARKRYRRWHVTASQDLFRRWHVRVTFGRIGCDGRNIRHEFVTEDAAAAFIRACLHRRATA
jgi:predicted DNA-binding WGR domain protein